MSLVHVARVAVLYTPKATEQLLRNMTLPSLIACPHVDKFTADDVIVGIRLGENMARQANAQLLGEHGGFSSV